MTLHPDEVPDVVRFVNEMRAKKAVETPPAPVLAIGGIMRAIKNLRLAGKALDPVDSCWDNFPDVFK